MLGAGWQCPAECFKEMVAWGEPKFAKLAQRNLPHAGCSGSELPQSLCRGGRQAGAGSWEQRTKEACLRSLTRLRRPGWHESKPPAVSVCSGGAAATYPSGSRVICALRCLPSSSVRTCGLVGPLLDRGCCPPCPHASVLASELDGTACGRGALYYITHVLWCFPS